jgi:hypothetical protein
VATSLLHVWFTPDSGLNSDIAPCPKSARSGHQTSLPQFATSATRIAARRRGSIGKTREAETFAVLLQVFWSPQGEQGPNLGDTKAGDQFA